MKERVFHLRKDLDAGSNIRRTHAYIRSIDRTYQPMPKLKARAVARAMLKRVK